MKIKATREALKNKEDGREQTGQRQTGRGRQATVRETERMTSRQTDGMGKLASWHASASNSKKARK